MRTTKTQQPVKISTVSLVISPWDVSVNINSGPYLFQNKYEEFLWLLACLDYPD